MLPPDQLPSIPHRRSTAVDAAFARFCAGGEPEALAAVFDATAAELLRVATHLCGRPDAAEDLVQATFVAAIEDRASWNRAQPVLPWLLGILANRARRLRRDDARAVDPTRLVLPEVPAPAVAAEAQELTQAVSDALASLPEPYRPVLNLHLRNGLSAQQIALALERPPGTVRTQIVRGLELLRRALPRGLAVGTAATIATAGRGLAAVRAAVLESARSSTVAVGVVATTTGALLVKKLVLSLVGLALLGAAAFAVLPRFGGADVEPASPTEGLASAPLATQPAPNELADAVASEPAEPSGRSVAVAATTASTPTPTTATLVVHVDWHDGAAAAGIHVRLQPHDSPAPELEELRIRTDGGGDAVFTDLEPGRWVVLTERAWRGGDGPVQLAAGETRRVEVKLLIGERCRGRVTDENGSPVASATVWLGASEPADVDDGYPVAMTDAEGRFRVERVAAGSVLWATGGGCYQSEIAAALFDRELVLRVHRGGTPLQGKVVADADGSPIAGATIVVGQVVRYSYAQTFGPALIASSRARSDALGRFELAGPPESWPLVLCACAPGFAPQRLWRPQGSWTPALEIRLQRGATLRGSVRDDHGAPVGDAQIEILYLALGSSPQQEPAWLRPRPRADARGAYTAPGLSSGTTHVKVRATQRVVVSGKPRSRELRGWAEVELVAGEDRHLDLVASEGLPIDGVVVDESGAPVPDLLVVLDAHPDRHRPPNTRTDVRGAFRFSDCERNCAYTLKVLAATAGSVLASQGDVRAGTAGLRFVVDRGAVGEGVLSGVALARDGTPYRGRLLAWRHDGSGQLHVQCGSADGSFRLERVPAGEWAIALEQMRRVPHPIFGKHWNTWFGPFTVRGGETVDAGTLRSPAPGTVRLHLTDQNGKPASGWAMLQPDTGLQTTAVIREGSWQSDEVAPGRYVVFMYQQHLTAVWRRIEVRSGEVTEVSMKLPPGVLQEFVGADDFPREVEVHCTWRDGDGNELWRERWIPGREHVGRWRMQRTLPEGRFRLELRFVDGKRAEAAFTISLAAPNPPPIELTLR